MSMVGEDGKGIPGESAQLPYVHDNILDTKVIWNHLLIMFGQFNISI
jgi:hypothetical protein